MRLWFLTVFGMFAAMGAICLYLLPVAMEKHGIIAVALLAIPAAASIMGAIASFKEVWRNE